MEMLYNSRVECRMLFEIERAHIQIVGNRRGKGKKAQKIPKKKAKRK